MPRNLGTRSHYEIHEGLEAGPIGILGRESDVVMATRAVDVASAFRAHQRFVTHEPILHVLPLRPVGLGQSQHGVTVLHAPVVFLQFRLHLSEQIPSLRVLVLPSAAEAQPDGLRLVAPFQSFLQLGQLVLLLQQAPHVQVIEPFEDGEVSIQSEESGEPGVSLGVILQH